MSKFTPAETVILKRLAHEAVNGMADPGGGELFGPRQKPLSYVELKVLRRVIADAEVKRTGDNLRQIKLPNASKMPSSAKIGVQEASCPMGGSCPHDCDRTETGCHNARIKTSQLLTEAASFIHNSKLDLQPSAPRGQGWRSFVRELRDRAKLFRDIEGTIGPALPPPFGDGRDWEPLPQFGDGRDGDFIV